MKKVMSRKDKDKWTAIKIDTSKAYDRVGWDGIIGIRCNVVWASRRVGVISFIIACLLCYSVMVNGQTFLLSFQLTC